MNFATFDLNLLRVLDAILRDGSTTKAGERLGLSQSAVSNALNRLRHSLDDPLFIRRGNQLVPTDFAAKIADQLREELNRIESLLTQEDSFDPMTAKGRFLISASDFFSELLMPPLADHLSKTAPNIVAQMVDLVPDSNVASIERYNADIALTPEFGFPDWINREPLFRSSFSVIARKGNPGLTGLQDGSILPLDVYCEMSHVMFSPEGNLAAMGDEALSKVGKARKMAMTVPFFSGVCRAVSTSDLVALVPSQLANHVAPSFGLSIFEPDFPIPRAQISAIWHKRSDENLMAKWMRQQIFDLMKPLDEG